MSSPRIPSVGVAQPPGSPNMIYEVENSVRQVETAVLEDEKQRILLTTRVDALANCHSEVEHTVAEEQTQRTIVTLRVDVLASRLAEMQLLLRQVSELLQLALPWPQANAETLTSLSGVSPQDAKCFSKVAAENKICLPAVCRGARV